jgi:hypothetical protein
MELHLLILKSTYRKRGGQSQIHYSANQTKNRFKGMFALILAISLIFGQAPIPHFSAPDAHADVAPTMTGTGDLMPTIDPLVNDPDPAIPMDMPVDDMDSPLSQMDIPAVTPDPDLDQEVQDAIVDAAKNYYTAVMTETGGHGTHGDTTSDTIQNEHGAALALVSFDDVTHVAVTSGDWDDATTWAGGEIPETDANVLIAQGVEVRLDFVNETVYRTIRIDGKLSFATDTDTGLMVDTLITSEVGELEIGTADNPVQNDVEAKIIITASGCDHADPVACNIDTAWDPNQLSRGIIAHGRTTIHGAVKTTQANLLQAPMQGDIELVLSENVTNWQAGDVLILAGTNGTNQDEQLYVAEVNGNRVTVVGFNNDGSVDEEWDGLKFNHNLPEGLQTFVMNISRNVVIESFDVEHADEMGINRRRGHIMFMHGAQSKTDTRYLGVYGMGRTDKRTRLESAEFDEDGNLVPDTGHNQVARYSFHFHRGGPANGPAIVQGLAIVDSPGLGLVNHSSNVQVSDSVAYGVVGSAWFTEAGDEIGFFKNVSAINMPGSGDGIESRSGMEGGVRLEIDFGHSGHGFWLQGGGVKLENVRVAGAASSGIIFFTEGLQQEGLGTMRFDTSVLDQVLDDPADVAQVGGGQSTIAVGSVPLHLDGALVIQSGTGIQTRFHLLNANHGVGSVIENVNIANLKGSTGINIAYTNRLEIKNSTVVGKSGNTRFRGTGITRNKVTRNITYRNLTVKGWETGIQLPERGTNRVIGGRFTNIKDLNLQTSHGDNRVIDITGDIVFESPTHRQRGGRTKYTIYLGVNLNPDMRDITKLFTPDRILINAKMGEVLLDGKQLYYYAQAADHVLFEAGKAAAYIPEELIGKTNQELWDLYGLALGGTLAPTDAEDGFEKFGIRALIGDPVVYPPKVKLVSRKYTNQLDAPVVFDAYDEAGDKQRITVDPILDADRFPSGLIEEGWNLVTVNVDGKNKSVFVYGDITPPAFQVNRRTAEALEAVSVSDLKKGFRVRGTILDDSFGSRGFSKRYSGKELKAMYAAALEAQGGDATQPVEIKLKFNVRDFAGNKTAVELTMVVKPDAIRAHVKERKELPRREVPSTLKVLLRFKKFRIPRLTLISQINSWLTSRQLAAARVGAPIVF